MIAEFWDTGTRSPLATLRNAILRLFAKLPPSPCRIAMNLLEGIQVYIEAKRSEGALWAKGAQNLLSFHLQVGDFPLERIRTNHVVTFLDGPLTSPAT